MIANVFLGFLCTVYCYKVSSSDWTVEVPHSKKAIGKVTNGTMSMSKHEEDISC